MEDINDKKLDQAQQVKHPSKKQLKPTSKESHHQQETLQNHPEVKVQEKQKPQEHTLQQSHKIIENAQKVKKQQERSKEKEILQYLSSHKIQLTQEQINEFVKKQNGIHKQFQAARLEQWMKENNLSHKTQQKQKKQKVQQKKHIDQMKESKKIQEKDKKQQKLAQILSIQQIQKFLKKNGAEQSPEKKIQVLKALNKQINSKLEILDATLQSYLKGTEEKDFAHFKQWLSHHEQQQIQAWSNAFQKSILAKQVETHTKKLQSIVNLADFNKANLNINLGAGDGKGKTALKLGILLKQPQKSIFSVKIQVKIKKKVQLRHFIQNQLAKTTKTDEFGVFKVIKLRFQESQKSLKIDIESKAFQQHMFKDLISFLEQKWKAEKKPVLKAQIQVSVRNSIRQDQSTLQNKRFIKWLAQGFTKSMKIQGNNKVTQHFTAPFAEYFPIFKVIKSGDVLLKLKQIQSVDKLFDKLGINDICQQTPTLQKYLQVMIKQHLDSNIVLWIGDILKYIFLFACNIPNERISIEVNINISHLLLYLSISSEACKELGEIISKTNLQQFS